MKPRKVRLQFDRGSTRGKGLKAIEKGTMLIDHETAKNLELVNNALHYKSNQSLFGESLFLFVGMCTGI